MKTWALEEQTQATLKDSKATLKVECLPLILMSSDNSNDAITTSR